MACKNLIKWCQVNGLETVALMARSQDIEGDYLTQENTSSIRVDLYQLDDSDNRTPVDMDGNVITDGSAYDTPDISSTIFDTLQTDARWSVDSTGYNILYKVATPDRGQRYEVHMIIVTNDETTLVQRWGLDSR